MRILTVHADYMEVEPLKKAIKAAEALEKEKKRYEEVLVVFTSVEKGDENVGAIAQKLVKEAGAIAEAATALKLGLQRGLTMNHVRELQSRYPDLQQHFQ